MSSTCEPTIRAAIGAARVFHLAMTAVSAGSLPIERSTRWFSATDADRSTSPVALSTTSVVSVTTWP